LTNTRKLLKWVVVCIVFILYNKKTETLNAEIGTFFSKTNWSLANFGIIIRLLKQLSQGISVKLLQKSLSEELTDRSPRANLQSVPLDKE